MKQSLLGRLFMFLAIVGIAGCNGGSTTSNPNNMQKIKMEQASKKNLEDDLLLMKMGSGINSITKKTTSAQSCLINATNEKNIYIANPKAMIIFNQTQDLSVLQQNLGVDINGRYGADRFTASMEAEFVNASKDNNYTTNVIYLYKYTGKSSFVDGSLNESDAALTPATRDMVHNDQNLFLQRCGDNYVEQMDAGATLGITISLSFNSHSDQEKFKAKFDATVGLASIGASIRQAAQNSNVHVKFSLSALQLGGEPQKLNDIFKSDNGKYPFLDCGSIGSQNENECNKMMAGIIDYAKTFKDQLSNPDGSIKLRNLYYTNPVISPYTSLGIKIGSINPSPATLKAMEDLTTNYDKAKSDYIFATHYLKALRDLLDTPTNNSLTHAVEQLDNQINAVYLHPSYNVVNCYRYSVSDQCITIKENVDAGIKRYALKEIEIQLLSYLQNNSYAVDLLTYNGGNVTDPASYQKVQGCIMAPISASNYYKYALSCDGKWIKITKELKIVENGLKGGLSISGLSYDSIASATGDKVKITYPDMGLNQDSIDPSFYFLDQVHIEIESSSASQIKLIDNISTTKLFRNQA
ncbi:MAG TPA: hypothetical protein PKD00_03780 [Burkholderiales bacterium]|nr:hypothetical protein [Burkholderiales bacterium]